MCRGFVGINLNPSPRTKSDMYSVMANYMHTSWLKNNDDGYFIGTHQKDNKMSSYRTLKYIPVLDKMEKLSSKMDTVVHGHARYTSVGVTADEYVHGWEFNGYTCSMNGTIEMDKKYMAVDNDSLSFFQLCFSDEFFSEDLEVWLKNIEQLYETVVDSGNGALFFVNNEHTIILNFNKPVTMHLLNDELVILNTNDDIHKDFRQEFTVNLNVTGERKLGKVNLTADKTITPKVRYETPFVLTSDFSDSWDDRLTVIDNTDGNVIHQEAVKFTKVYSSKNRMGASSSGLGGYRYGFDDDTFDQYYSSLKGDAQKKDGKQPSELIDSCLARYEKVGDEMIVELIKESKDVEELRQVFPTFQP